MKYYVYELYDLNGSIVYVGDTITPERRLRQHTKHKGGKFYGQNVFMNIVAEFETRPESYNHQCKLQKEYNLPTDRDNSGIQPNTQTICPPNIVEEIQSKYSTGNYTMRKLANEYNISYSTVNRIINKIRGY